MLPIDGATPAVDPNGSHRDAAHPRTSHGASHGSTTSDLADQERYLREHADTGGPQIAEFAASLQRFAPTERDRPRARSSAQTSSPQPGEHEDLKPTIVKAAESLPSSPMTVKAEQDLDANRSAVFKSHVASSPSTPKKRKRKALASDNGQFEGMQEIPDRLADNLDSESEDIIIRTQGFAPVTATLPQSCSAATTQVYDLPRWASTTPTLRTVSTGSYTTLVSLPIACTPLSLQRCRQSTSWASRISWRGVRQERIRSRLSNFKPGRLHC